MGQRKGKRFWQTVKKWLEPSKKNIVILSNSKRTMQMKGLRIKKILDLNVDYGRWKKNYKARKEMVFQVLNSSGQMTRKRKTRKRKTRKRKTRRRRRRMRRTRTRRRRTRKRTYKWF